MMMRLDRYQAKRLLACNQDAKLVRKMIIKCNTNARVCVCVYSWNYYDIWELSRWLLWLLATETCLEIDASSLISQEYATYEIYWSICGNVWKLYAAGGREALGGCSCTYQSSLWLDQRSILSVHLVVEATGVAQIVPSAVASPQRCRGGATIDALATLCKQKRTTRKLDIKTDENLS